MDTKVAHRLFALLIVFSLSCNSATGLIGNGGATDGPENFTAVLTAPDIVLLSWDAVEGATGYILELSIDGGDSVPIITLPPELTSYEDLTAPEKGNLIYQVQVVAQSDLSGESQVSIATGARAPHPFTVNPEYDEENATVTVIGAQGGTVSLVDSNGVEFMLNIPEGGLSADTEIRMTALTSIQEWPLDGNAIGTVRLEPEGLVLNDVAILTIGYPVDVNPDLAIVGFAFEADGQEFHLQPSDEKIGLTNELPFGTVHLAGLDFQATVRHIVMPVMELKVSGVGQASHESVSQYVKDHAPTDAGAALEQKRAAEDAVDNELAPVKKNADPVREQAYEIGKAIFLAKNCEELNSQIVSFQKWRYSSEYQGLNDGQKREYTKQIWDELIDKVKEVLEKGAEDCEKSRKQGEPAPADSPCIQALLDKISHPPTNTASDFNLDLKNKLENKLSDDELQDIEDKLKKCKKAAYQIVGGAGDWQTDTAVCDIMKPFTLTGGGFIMNLTGGLSGTYTYTGPYNAHGGDSYGILLPDGFGKPGTMTGGGTGCVESPKGTFCNNAAESYTLTPIDSSADCTQ